MKNEPCPHEDAVTRAIRTGQDDEAWQAHIAQCHACGEIAQVMRWMGGLAADLGVERKLPDPGVVWLRAQWAERQRLEERALRPVVMARAVFQAGLWVALLLLILWIWPVVDGLIDRLRPAALADSLAALDAHHLATAAAMLFVAAGCLHLHALFRRG